MIGQEIAQSHVTASKCNIHECQFWEIIISVRSLYYYDTMFFFYYSRNLSDQQLISMHISTHENEQFSIIECLLNVTISIPVC